MSTVVGTLFTLLEKKDGYAADAAADLAKITGQGFRPALFKAKVKLSDGNVYTAALFPLHWLKIKSAAPSAARVEKVLEKLLLAFNATATDVFEDIDNALEPPKVHKKKCTIPPPPLGACDYTDDQGNPECIDGLSKIDCEQYMPHGAWQGAGSHCARRSGN